MCSRFGVRAMGCNLLIKGKQVWETKNQECRFGQAKFAHVSQTFERKKRAGRHTHAWSLVERPELEM